MNDKSKQNSENSIHDTEKIQQEEHDKQPDSDDRPLSQNESDHEADSKIKVRSPRGRPILANLQDKVKQTASAKTASTNIAIKNATKRTAEFTKRSSSATREAGIQAAHKSLATGREVIVSGRDVATALQERTLNVVAPIARKVGEMTHNVLTTHIGNDVNIIVRQLVAGGPTIDDRQIDAAYITAHSSADEQAKIAERETREISTQNTVHQLPAEIDLANLDGEGILARISSTVVALARDGTTSKGLALFNWDDESIDKVSNYLNSEIGIPVNWLPDLKVIDVAEFLSSTIAVVVLTFRWNEADAKEFASLGAGLATTGIVSANPIVLVLAVVILARAFHLSRQSSEYGSVVDGMAQGTFESGATIAAVALVGAGAAVPGLGLLVSVITGVLAAQVSSRVSIVEISDFVAKRTIALAAVIKSNVE